MKSSTYFYSLLTICCLLYACKPAADEGILLSADNLVSELQKTLITAAAGDQIKLPAGTFEFKRSLSLNDTPGVTISGAGKGKTILSFKGQIEGAEGILIKNADDISLEGFTVADSKGDAIKVQDCTNVIMRDLETTWTTGKLATNGAYGLYPVSSTNVLMENCEASYAMDAGIYVGQSNNVVVRNNYVHHNVAGLEIENTKVGEVYGNRAHDNTAGMLIFDMPDLPQANGDKIKFYDNYMENNNGENFAPKGMIVSTLPPGTGMNIMAHSNIDIYNNTIKGHKTVGVMVNSWMITGQSYKSEEFDPYCTNVYIHDNKFINNQGETDQTTDAGKLISGLFGNDTYDILIDGIFKPNQPNSYCFKNNGDISFANLNASKGLSPEEMMKNLDHDMSPFDCELPDFDTKDHNAWLALK